MAIIVDPDGGVKVEFGPARSHPGAPAGGAGRPAIIVHEWRPPQVVHEWEPPREVRE